MIITPNMSLFAWTSVDDDFDHTQLATNWSRADAHDHTPGKGVELDGTAAIIAGSITAASIANGTITGSKIANNTITGANINTASNLIIATLNTNTINSSGAVTIANGNLGITLGSINMGNGNLNITQGSIFMTNGNIGVTTGSITLSN